MQHDSLGSLHVEGEPILMSETKTTETELSNPVADDRATTNSTDPATEPVLVISQPEIPDNPDSVEIPSIPSVSNLDNLSCTKYESEPEEPKSINHTQLNEESSPTYNTN